MNLFLLAAESNHFFYEDWIIIKQLIWLFGKCMDGIMYVLDKVGVHNIALCILIFTVITKFILLPLTIKQQKTTRLNAYITPELQKIQKKYEGRRDQASQQKMLEEQQAIREKYGISMSAGCLPLLIQMPILFALYPVIYRMDEYVSYLGVLAEKLSETQMAKMYNLLGINLKEAPGFRLTWAILIPVLVVVTQIVSMQIMSNQQKTQQEDNPMAVSMKTMNYFMPLMLGFVSVNLAAFLGWYWIIQSLVTTLQQLVINKKLSKIPIEEMIRQNLEKVNKKRAKQGLPPLGEKATRSTKNIVSQPSSKEKSAEDEEARLARQKAASDYYASHSANAGSLSAKANMVRLYDERKKNQDRKSEE